MHRTSGLAAEEEMAFAHSAEMLAAAEAAAGLGFWEWDLRTGEHRWSRGVYRVLGLPGATAPSWEAFLSVVHPEDRARVAASARTATTHVTVRTHECRIVRPDGTPRQIVWRGRILRSATGAPSAIIATVQDVTEQRRAEHEVALASAERARSRQTQQLLAITDAALSRLSLDELLTELLARAARALPARTAALLLIEGPGDALVLRATHGLDVAPEQTALIAPGRGLAARISEEHRAVAITGPEIAGLRLTALRTMGAVAGAPLFVDGRVIGVLEVGRTEAIAFGDDDLALLQLAADRTALALDHARVTARERHIAQTLQRSLLPTALPEIDGITLEARYLPSGEGHVVGGDFYDVVGLGDDRWLLVIGDVCGKGAEAAALTAMVRYTLRAEAMHEPRPGELLGLLNDTLAAQRSGIGFCTVLCLLLDLASGARVTLASGGHPMPLLVGAGGAVAFPPSTGGPLVGVIPAAEFPEQQLTLARGDRVITFTDGLLEARAPERILAPEDLAAALAGMGEAGLGVMLDALQAQALGPGAALARDDIALLAVGVGSGPRAPCTPSQGEREVER